LFLGTGPAFAGCGTSSGPSAPPVVDADGGLDGSADGSGTNPNDGGGDATAADASRQDASPADAGTAPFVLVGSAPEPCPFVAAKCATDWPSAADGTVSKLTSRETFGGKTSLRTFHVFVPAAVAAAGTPAPVVVLLHGGNGSGLKFLAQEGWLSLAAGNAAGLPWKPNTATCRAAPETEATGLAYRNINGACDPPAVSVSNRLPFVAVFPDGVADPGTQDVRHWEDGRLPSPGFDTPTPNRDDVGFLEHLLAVVLDPTATPRLDRQRVYVAGVSNGGMMTQRLAASVATRPAGSPLATVAAFAAFVSDYPEPLPPPALTVPFGLALFHGKNLDTPDCPTDGCTSPVVSGDNRMPFGVVGGIHYVNSPDRGRVHSAPDTITAWTAAFAQATGSSATTTTEAIGYFTTRRAIGFAGSAATMETWETDGGGHSFLSSRQDFQANARAWDFLSSFRRDAGGALVRAPSTALTGRW
jgi:poly(3-hydroxybutyrate) depolymerase